MRTLFIAVLLSAGAWAGYDGTSIASINQSVSGSLADIRKNLVEAREKMSAGSYDGDRHSDVLAELYSAESDLANTAHAKGNARAKAETKQLAAEIKKLRSEALNEAMPIYKRRFQEATDGGGWASDKLNNFMKWTHDKDPRVRAFVAQCGCKFEKSGLVDCYKQK